MTDPADDPPAVGRTRRGSAAYGRLLAALFCAGIATFAQLYSPQAVLPLISADLHIGAADAALTISASTIGLAIGVIPWSTVADRIGRVRAISHIGHRRDRRRSARTVRARPSSCCSPGGSSKACSSAVSPPSRSPISPRRSIPRTRQGRQAPSSRAPPSAAPWPAGVEPGRRVRRVAHRCLHRGGAVRRRGAGLRQARPATARLRRRRGSPAANPEGTLAHRLTANLRSPRQLALFAQGFLLMGGFVAMYNFLGFRLTGAPFHLSPFVVSLVFLAYLAGTWASARAGAEATRVRSQAGATGLHRRSWPPASRSP